MPSTVPNECSWQYEKISLEQKYCTNINWLREGKRIRQKHIESTRKSNLKKAFTPVKDWLTHMRHSEVHTFTFDANLIGPWFPQGSGSIYLYRFTTPSPSYLNHEKKFRNHQLFISFFEIQRTDLPSQFLVPFFPLFMTISPLRGDRSYACTLKNRSKRERDRER